MKLALRIAMLGAMPLPGQNPPPGDQPISTDRPAVAASSTVVPQGSFQMENGFLVSYSHTFDGPETTLRFGVTATTELRFSAPDYDHEGGFGDISIGMKQQLDPAAGFDVSLIVFLSLPTGAKAESSRGYDPGLQLPWSRKLSDDWTAGGQFALYWPTQPAGRNLTGESTFLLDRQLTKRWTPSSNTPAISPSAAAHAICFTSAPPIKLRLYNRSTSTRDSASPRQLSIITSGSATLSDSWHCGGRL